MDKMATGIQFLHSVYCEYVSKWMEGAGQNEGNVVMSFETFRAQPTMVRLYKEQRVRYNEWKAQQRIDIGKIGMGYKVHDVCSIGQFVTDLAKPEVISTWIDTTEEDARAKRARRAARNIRENR